MQPGSGSGADRRSGGLFGQIDRVHLSWWQAWAKTAAIVLYFVLVTVFIPSWLIELRAVAKLPRLARDLIGSGSWLVALVVGIYVLWWAERNQRI